MQQLIILSGWGMDKCVWTPVDSFLSEHFELIYCDWYNVTTVEEYKIKVFSLIDENVVGHFSILGWSLGSLLAIDAACHYSDRIDNLILVSGTSRFTTDKENDYFCGCSPIVVKKMKNSLLLNKQKTMENFRKSMFTENEIQQGYFLQFSEISGETSLGYDLVELQAGLDFLIQSDCREKLKKIKAPLLLIHGAKDTVCPVSSSAYIKIHVNSEVVFKIMEDTGHVPFFTKAAELSSVINSFIEK